jgi:hypothetical protein
MLPIAELRRNGNLRCVSHHFPWLSLLLAGVTLRRARDDVFLKPMLL